jgi:ribosomal protein S18 acetylase RimI-like enzyme
MVEDAFSIHDASYVDRSRLANLIHFGPFIQQHLDWKPPLDWIGRQPYLLLEKNNGLLATLACPPDLPETTWVRLFAVSSQIKPERAWRLLWEATLDRISHHAIIQVVALSMQSWFTDLLLSSNFEQTDFVTILICDNGFEIQKPTIPSVNIRPMMHEDLPFIFDIDNSVFGCEWRNSYESLDLAFQQSSYTTVAEIEDEIIGYQYSTSSGLGGHLARLAVMEAMQRNGIGFLLIQDLLMHFRQLGKSPITVNTQQSNLASLALYAKAGFKTTGEKYRVYKYFLGK